MKKTRFTRISTALLLTLAVFPVSAKELAVGKAERITIDGRLDEPSWLASPAGKDFTKLHLSGGGAAVAGTDFKVLADAENLFLGIRCAEPNMVNLKAGVSATNSPLVWNDDVVEIFLHPTGFANEYYQFAACAGGGTWQMYFEERGNVRRDAFFSPDYETKVFHGKDFWSVEMKIPFASFYMTRAEKWSAKWRCNVTREHRNPLERSSWSALSAQFSELDSFGFLSSIPPKPSAKDYALTGIEFFPTGKNDAGEILGTARLAVEAPQAAEAVLHVDSEALHPVKAKRIRLVKGMNSVDLEQIVCTKPGTRVLNTVLADESENKILGRRCQVFFEYQPLKFFFEKPGYGGCFFPGQKADKIKGKIKVAVDVKEIELFADGKSYALPVKNGYADFEIALPENFESIALEVQAGKESLKTVVRKLPPVKRTMVWIENNRFILNGKPVFICSWYGGGDNATYNLSKALLDKKPLLNYHRTTIPWCYNIEARNLRDVEESEGHKDAPPSQKVYDYLKKQIELVKDRNFLFYYLCDEPECRGVSAVWLKYQYDYIKKLDPYHPVMIISGRPERFVECSDICCAHPYALPMIDSSGRRVLSRPITIARDRLRFCRQTTGARKDKPLMICNASFAEVYDSIYAEYPSFDETMATIWSTIAEGGQGAMPFIYYDHFSRPDMRIGYEYIYSSIGALEMILTTDAGPEAVRCSNPAISTRFLIHNEKALLLLVNPTDAEASGTVTAEKMKNYPVLQRFRESASVKPDNGSIHVKMAPYQVMIFTSDKMDSGLQTLAEIRERIAKAEYARTHRGNLLFGKQKDVNVSACRSSLGVIKARNALFDGMTDTLAWRPLSGIEPWIELLFSGRAPKFSKIKLYGVVPAQFKIKFWKLGEWIEQKFTVKQGEEPYLTEIDFAGTVSTVKMRFDFKTQDGMELYELELLK